MCIILSLFLLFFIWCAVLPPLCCRYSGLLLRMVDEMRETSARLAASPFSLPIGVAPWQPRHGDLTSCCNHNSVCTQTRCSAFAQYTL